MEESSVRLCKGRTPGQGLLIIASLLSFWHMSTTAHVTTELVPPHVAEGENVLLAVHGPPKNLRAYAWFKGLPNTTRGIAVYTLHNNLSAPGPLHSGRETVYHNGSLLLENVTQKDTGIYTLQTYNTHGEILSTTSRYLRVHAFLWNCEFLATSPKLTIESVPPIVAEGRSVLLLVHNPPENIAGFVWFKGTTTIDNFVVSQYTLYKKLTVWGPAYGGRETLYSDGSLLLHSVTVKDSGLYILRILWTDMRSQDAQVQLQVDTSLSPFCNLLNSSQFTIQPVPRYAAEGEDVLFQVHSLPEDLQSFSWYKLEDKNLFHKIVEYSRAMDSISWEPTHRGRGMVYKNGSLMLQGITEKDAGMYTLSILNKYFKVERAYVEVYVKKNVTQPFVRISDTMVAGHRSVTFTCISPDTDISIRWIFNKQNLEITERMTLSPTKCGLRINPVRIEDTGDYQCEVSNRFSLKTSPPISWPR
uniref:Ig-like domain-containing protein n=1 Tax=Cricetulus griseus TaxID=10029 RepID=A0A8C2QBY2_CRIGR